jgi:hypothetical protein
MEKAHLTLGAGSKRARCGAQLKVHHAIGSKLAHDVLGGLWLLHGARPTMASDGRSFTRLWMTAKTRKHLP